MQKIFKITAVSVFGVGSYLVGRLHEQEKRNNYDKSRGIFELPGISLGTVHAATVFNENQVVPVKPAEVEPVKATGPSPAALRVSQIMKYGFPSLDNIRSLDDYVLSYDKRNRVAYWVFEHLTSDSVKHNKDVDRSKCDFYEDKSIHQFFRSTNADYKGSGYDRGHLAAAGNHKHHQKQCEQTFLLSNMAPQVGNGFNRHSWNRLEKYVRKLTKNYMNVYVCTGPLYLPRREPDGKTYVKYEVIGANTVSVPTHFFKVVVMETSNSELEMEAYVMPNEPISDETPLNVFQVPVESIERASGLLLFDRIPRDKLKKVNGKKASAWF